MTKIFHTIAIAGLMAASATVATAQTAPQPAAATIGATVYDSAGGVVGTISSVTADAIVISTGAHDVAVPPASVGSGAKGPTMAMTKAQLDAAFVQQQDQANAALKSQLVAGAAVYGSDGATQVGTIKVADAQYVTLTTSTGGEAKLPVAGFSSGPKGLLIGMTAAQLNAAIGGAARK
ncbi:hypothetical protein [uncultured Sphingomonas sp.]|uniref:hypothetical protein n=1 Tax=uncultured Sphingomonas sp. TaxID=158754 RepID=UPI0035CB0FD9